MKRRWLLNLWQNARAPIFHHNLCPNLLSIPSAAMSTMCSVAVTLNLLRADSHSESPSAAWIAPTTRQTQVCLRMGTSVSRERPCNPTSHLIYKDFTHSWYSKQAQCSTLAVQSIEKQELWFVFSCHSNGA